MRCAVVATAVVGSVLLLWCPGVVTGDATDDTQALVCSSSSLACARPLHITGWCPSHVRPGSGALVMAVTVRGSLVTRMVTTRENHPCIS